MTVTTATVETLTAEVRVLNVGNRQVTLSVAKQLDDVPVTSLEVFGRVKLGGSSFTDLVIGRDETGTLALARYGFLQKRSGWRAFIEVDERYSAPEDRPTMGWGVRRGTGENRDLFMVDIDGIPSEIFERNCNVQFRHQPGAMANDWTPGAGVADMIEQAHHELSVANDGHALYVKCKDAPLIVLAGLR